jgi:hypothetical protein
VRLRHGDGEQRGLSERLRRDADDFRWGVPNPGIIVPDEIAVTWGLNRLGRCRSKRSSFD